MATTYLSPGVYVEEVSGGVKPIAGVGTSTGAFVGIAEKGVIGKAVLVTNWTQFKKEFGGFIPNGYLAYAVYGFFAEGGTSCYVVRAASDSAVKSSKMITVDKEASTTIKDKGEKASTTIKDKDGISAVDVLKVTARSEGTVGNSITVIIEDPTDADPTHLKLTVGGNVFDDATITDIVGSINNDVSAPINVVKTNDKRPLNGSYNLSGGSDAVDVLKVTARLGGTVGNSITVIIKDPTDADPTHFKLTVGGNVFDDATITDIVGSINNDVSAPINVVKTNDKRPLNGSYNLSGGSDAVDVLKVTARSEGIWGKRITVKIEDPSEKPATTHFKFTVKYAEAAGFKEEYEGEGVSEIFDNVKMQDVEDKINGVSAFIKVEVADNKRPLNGSYDLSGGVDGVEDADFTGDADNKKGLHAFDEVDDINIVAIPDKAGDREVIGDGLLYCKNRKDCFFVADAPYGLIPTKVVEFRKATGEYAGNAFNSSYGALYYPWVYINDPLTGKKKLIPPSGVVAGTYAYTDSTRGVHKAPAGITDGYLDSVVGIERIITKGEHDVLNPAQVNVIRSLPAGLCIWGARTLSADSEWMYINVRRLLLYIEESIDEGTQWVVFEPNDPALWGKVKRNLTAFLTRVWRDGALFGATPEEAFFVKVDEENNPAEVRDAGQLIIEVGVAPVKPAEFVIIRISQKTLAKA